MNKAIQYREDGKFYLFDKPEESSNCHYFSVHNRCDGNCIYDEELKSCIAAGKEIINPGLLPITLGYNHQLNLGAFVHNDSGKKIEWGDIFDCPDNIEFEEIFSTKQYVRGLPDYTVVGIRLKLKQEVKPVETQDELFEKLIFYIRTTPYDDALSISRLKSKFTITRNKNGNE